MTYSRTPPNRGGSPTGCPITVGGGGHGVRTHERWRRPGHRHDRHPVLRQTPAAPAPPTAAKAHTSGAAPRPPRSPHPPRRLSRPRRHRPQTMGLPRPVHPTRSWPSWDPTSVSPVRRREVQRAPRQATEARCFARKALREGGCWATEKSPPWQPCEKWTIAPAGSASARASTPGWNGSWFPETTRTGLLASFAVWARTLSLAKSAAEAKAPALAPWDWSYVVQMAGLIAADGGEQFRALLGKQDGAEATHRDSHRRVPLRREPQPEVLAAGDAARRRPWTSGRRRGGGSSTRLRRPP